jgi:hypothetical protein
MHSNEFRLWKAAKVDFPAEAGGFGHEALVVID